MIQNITGSDNILGDKNLKKNYYFLNYLKTYF